MSEIAVLFVCMGNICRSPTAEGMLRARLVERGWETSVRVDSAGTHDFHIGGSPDARSCAAAAARGLDLSSLRGRQVSVEDFEAFDYVLAMDRSNHRALQQLCPKGRGDRLRLFLEFAPDLGLSDVPDPYYGAGDGFEHVLDIVTVGIEGLLEEIGARLKSAR